MIVYEGDTVSICKFKSTGVAALCVEVARYVDSDRACQDNIDRESARFVEGEVLYKVVFSRLDKEAA